MAEAPKPSGSFGTRFLPGLIVGLVVGLLLGAFGTPFLLDRNNTLEQAKKSTTAEQTKVPRHQEELPRDAAPVDPNKKPEEKPANPTAPPASNPAPSTTPPAKP